MNKDYSAKEIGDLVEMSNADSRFDLYKIGESGSKNGAVLNGLVAATEVKEKHFPEKFKV